MTDTKHSPIPWRVETRLEPGASDEHEAILDASDEEVVRAVDNGDGGGFAIPVPDISDEDASFIVRACNAHDDLLAACEVMQVHINDDTDQPVPEVTCAMIQAAIAKAKGES